MACLLTRHLLVLALVPALLLAQSSEEPPPLLPDRKDASDRALISDREAVELVDDSNVAEALSRRPDLQFSNLTIDGEKSNLALEDIPADAVSEIELLRAVTADLDADSRGGSLNLSFSPTFLLEKPVIQLDGWGRYSEGKSTWMQGASASYSRAFGDFGIRIQASHSHGHDTFEGYYLNWEPKDSAAQLYTPNYLIQNREEEWQQNRNLSVSMDYRFSDKLHAFIRVNASRREKELYQPRILYHFNRGTYESASRTLGSVFNAYADRDLIAYETETDQRDFLAGWVYESDSWRADFRILGEFQRYQEPDWVELQFRTPPIELNYRLNHQFLPRIDSASVDLNEPAQFAFDELLREHTRRTNDRWVIASNLRHDFEIWGLEAYLKAGLKWTHKLMDQSVQSRIFTGFDGIFTLADLAWNYGAESLLVPGVNWGSFPTLADARDFASQHESSFQFNLMRSALKADPATYRAEENLGAAYAMLNLRGERLRTILGFRVERTSLDYRAKTVIINEAGDYVTTEPGRGSNNYTELFPSVHLRYFLGSRMTLIASWTGTIERPYFGYTVPYRYIDYNSREIAEGNPQLKPTLYQNVDVSVDVKLSESSLFSLELFSKEVDDIVFWEVSQITDGTFSKFTRGTHANGPSATERGIRAILTQDLAELNDALNGFSLLLKYSYQDSKTQYPGRESETLPVTYRPRNRYEATLIYERQPFYLRIDYAYEDAELVTVFGASWQDRYEIPQEHLSLHLSYQWSPSARIYCEVSGLLESYAKTYYGETSRPSGIAWRSKQLELGLKIRF